MKHLHIKGFCSHKVINITVFSKDESEWKKKSTNFNYIQSIYKKNILSFKPINKFKFGYVKESMNKWDLRFCYLCNGLVQAEGRIQFFSFCCMYRKKSFGKKARILWERNKKPFRIPHWFSFGCLLDFVERLKNPSNCS